MSIVIDRKPEAKFEELENPETSPTAEIYEAVSNLAKGDFFIVEASGEESTRGLSRRVTVAIKRFHATKEGVRAEFRRKRIGPSTFAIQRAA